ncbi:MAG: SOS response-associated peptidase [Candidatus Cloacimonadaceae bacterium]|nr:SOS response-associated peptidase [Candidatus Cloacimonadaceae bacterium]
MCGRFAQVIKHDELHKLTRELRLSETSEQLELNYNVAPTHTVAAALSKTAGRYIGFFRWGFISSWSKEISKIQIINVRSETILEKSIFRVGLQRRRCLIPANGFYEWRQSDKQPFFIHSATDELLHFAGIFDEWYTPDGSYVQSLAIITAAANTYMRPIHQRMPVLLFERARELWLDHKNIDGNYMHRFLRPAGDDRLIMHPVSRAVNKVSFTDPECIEEVSLI